MRLGWKSLSGTNTLASVNYGQKKFYNIGSRPVIIYLIQKIKLPCQEGATTLSITTFSIMSLRIMTLSIMTFSIMTLNIMPFSIMPFS